MKTLQVIPTFGSGGAEHFVLELSNELYRQGHQVDILSLYDVPDDNLLRKALNPQIEVYTLHKKNGFEPRLFYAVKRFIDRGDYDAVHCHVGAIKYVTFAAFLCRKTRFVATIHSEARREAGRYLDKWSRKLMFRNNVCLPVTISKESERSFEEFYGKKTVTIFNGVSLYEKKKTITLRDNDKQTVFLHVASCQTIKNQQLLFAAFNKLLDLGCDAKIVWIGNTMIFQPLFESLKPLMKRNVVVLGEVDNVRDYMVAADSLCLSSKMEGMPMTIIEAFSVGCPVLCTPVGGCVNMIDIGVNGLMSEDLEVESYFQMMKTFIELTEEEHKEMSAKAKVSFAKYNIENCANQYLKIYEMNKK